MNKKQIAELQNTILSRYYKEWRKLPRRETQDPYAIHISEVMSQQTQVDRVIPYRKKWMEEIPNYNTLATLPKLDLLSYWSWLGFNSRAIRLQECAKYVIENYNWKLPQDKEALLRFPWIGPYTASAICSFAWNLPEPVIDTNIRRVLIFLLKLPEDIPYKELEKITEELIPEWKSRDWNNALMDYWAVHLTARKTKIKSLWKQSKFEWSDREVRGRILKQITKNKEALSIEKIKEEFPHKNIKKILNELEKENIIKESNGFVNI
jgi:A/G-specific adenine glycosylase